MFGNYNECNRKASSLVDHLILSFTQYLPLLWLKLIFIINTPTASLLPRPISLYLPHNRCWSNTFLIPDNILNACKFGASYN